MPNKRALIVDDSTTAQYRLKKMLRGYNLDIDTADSGEAALRYLAHQSSDVIFMDHLMPGMDGFRALQIIKSHPETAMIPVIMYTSKSGDLYTGQARALGALDVVSKDTISSAELSKVLEGIHIVRKNKTAETVEDEAESPVDIAANTELEDDIPELKIERRAPHPASVEQSRNLELRLSHMELALEDNRRVITARVARELNSLRHTLKKEIGELIATNQQTTEPAAGDSPPSTPGNTGSSGFSKFVFFVALVVIILISIRIITLLTESQAQQQELSDQVAALSQKSPEKKVTTTETQTVAKAPALPAQGKTPSYLPDLTWLFNQNGQLTFYQNRIEPKKLIQLYELLNRISNSGFKGDAWVNIYVGNFCVSLDNYGTAQMPKENANMNDCSFSSDIYGLDKVMEEYTHDAEAALNNLEQGSKNIRIIISTLSESDNYPERKPNLTVKTWNNAAQNHNRIEIRLEPK